MDKITISEETQIDLPANRHLFSLEKRDWDRVKRMVNQIADPTNRWENAGWAIFSLGTGFILSYWASPAEYRNTIFVVLFFACMVISLILFVVSYSISKLRTNSKKEVLLEMEDIENNIKTSSGTPS